MVDSMSFICERVNFDEDFNLGQGCNLELGNSVVIIGEHLRCIRSVSERTLAGRRRSSAERHTWPTGGFSNRRILSPGSARQPLCTTSSAARSYRQWHTPRLPISDISLLGLINKDGPQENRTGWKRPRSEKKQVSRATLTEEGRERRREEERNRLAKTRSRGMKKESCVELVCDRQW